MTAIVGILAIVLILPLGLDLMWWRYDRQGEGPVQMLAVLAGLSFAVMLLLIGFAMIGPGGSNTYPSPARASMFALPLLPLGYWAVATRKLPAAGGGLVLAAMALVAFILWQPLFGAGWMRRVHSDTMAMWSGVWLVSALPFAALMLEGRMRRA